MSGVLGTGSRLHLRLFIERLEVPVIAANVTASVGSPAACQVEMVPTDAALRLLPRTVVHLFYLDANSVRYAGDSPDGRRDDVVNDSAYKLLFCGEAFDIVYSKSGTGQRSVVLNCLDFSNHWDTSYLYQMRFVDSGAVGAESEIAGSRRVFVGAGGGGVHPFDDIISQPANVISDMAGTKTPRNVRLSGVSDSLGGLLRVLEAVGGVQGDSIGLNAWSTISERRVRLLDQIAADSGETAKNLYRQSVLLDWLKNRLGDLGEVISFRRIIELINSFIFYNVVPNPVAVYLEGDRTVPDYPPTGAEIPTGLVPDMLTAEAVLLDKMRARGWDGSGTKPPVHRSSGWRSLAAAQELASRGIGAGEHSRHNYGMAIDVSLNVASNGMGFAQGKKATSTDPVTLGASQGLYQLALNLVDSKQITESQQLINEMEAIAVGAGTRFQLFVDFYRDLGEVVSETTQATGVGLTWGGDFKKSDDVFSLFSLGNDPVHVMLSDAASRIDALRPPPSEPDPALSTEGRQSLITQIFRPDVWYVAPPACNVIYPEEFGQLTFRRQMMLEFTRFQLDTYDKLVGASLTRQTYFAPVLSNEESLTVGGIGSAAKAIIYEHEKFSGIVPRLEHMTEESFYASVVEGREDIFTEDSGAVDSKIEAAAYKDEPENPIDRYASRATAFKFLSNRYAARSLSVSGIFLPRLVAGFPGVVIDKPPTTGSSRPIHFLGMVVSVQHSLSAVGGANTFVTMSHARSHRSSSNEIDDLFAKSALEEGNAFSLQQRDVTTAIDVTKTHTAGERRVLEWVIPHVLLSPTVPTSFEDTGLLLGLLGPNDKQVTKITLKGPSTQVSAADPELLSQVPWGTSGPVTVPFATLEVVEKDAETVGIEEAIRPPWVSDDYSNANIGDNIYTPFFDCKSILDGTGTDTVEEAVDALAKSYALVSGGGMQAPGHIWARTRRGGATLNQVLLRSAEDREAFHYFVGGAHSSSRGGQPFENLEGLDLDQKLRGQFNDDKQEIRGDMDPRKERYERARVYQDELLRMRGFRG